MESDVQIRPRLTKSISSFVSHSSPSSDATLFPMRAIEHDKYICIYHIHKHKNSIHQLIYKNVARDNFITYLVNVA